MFLQNLGGKEKEEKNPTHSLITLKISGKLGHFLLLLVLLQSYLFYNHTSASINKVFFIFIMVN